MVQPATCVPTEREPRHVGLTPNVRVQPQEPASEAPPVTVGCNAGLGEGRIVATGLECSFGQRPVQPRIAGTRFNEQPGRCKRVVHNGSSGKPKPIG